MTGNGVAAAAFIFLLVTTAPPALGSISAPARGAHEREIARCIQQTSGGRVWLERTLWGLRDQEGGWPGAEIANRDGSHDLGPLQINSWWVPKLGTATGASASKIRWWLKHDVCFNVGAARWIFLSGLAATRDYWKAVGVYHSPKAWRQRRYARGVARRLSRRFGPAAFHARSIDRPSDERRR